MSDELISLSDFLDWVDERMSLYADWARDAMDDVDDNMGHGNSYTLIDSCTDAIIWLKYRDIFMEVKKRVCLRFRVDEDLIERSVLLDMLSEYVNTNKDRLRRSVRRAVECGRHCSYAVMLEACKEAMRHEDVCRAYRRMYLYVRCMPTAGTIVARLQKGVIIHEKH